MNSDMISDWLAGIVAAEHPPADVIAFNVGLFQTDSGYTAYLTGSRAYDPDDDDWACDEAYAPTERYCPLPAATKGATWKDIHDRIAEELRTFLASPVGQASFLGRATAVTVGFDDGDLVRVA